MGHHEIDILARPYIQSLQPVLAHLLAMSQYIAQVETILGRPFHGLHLSFFVNLARNLIA